MREALARAYFRSARFGDAEREFRAALDIEPVNDYAHYGVGLCRLRAGDRAGARAHLRLATVMRPDNADYQDALAQAGWLRRQRSIVRLLRSRRRDLAGRHADPGLCRGVAQLRGAGRRVVFLTNNSSIPSRATSRGSPRSASRPIPTDVCTSAQAAAAFLARALAPGAAVLACAGPGVVEALTERGLRRGRERSAVSRGGAGG